MKTLGLPARITKDSQRTHFRAWRVIAFPTVFVVGPGRRIEHVVRGYGPPLAARVVAALEYAAGLIDEAVFRQRTSSAPTAKKDPAAARATRRRKLAEQLMRRGKPAPAEKVLREILTRDADDRGAIALLARACLMQKDVAGAEQAIARFTALAGNARELRLLRAELALTRSEWDAAARLLEGLAATTLRVVLLKGRMLEQTGRVKEAAALYRRMLERLRGARD